jgi:16S rRNA processing protein RimM
MAIIEYGKVLRPHGIHGEVKVIVFGGELEDLSAIERLVVVCGLGGEQRELQIEGVKYRADGAIVKFGGVDSKEQAESLRGVTLFVDTEELPEAEEGEYYWHELIGLGVYDEEGRRLGTVRGLLDRASQSLLVVAGDFGEFYVPMVEVFIKEVNLKESRIVIHLLPGLID